jgi:outer membrane protein TolC
MLALAFPVLAAGCAQAWRHDHDRLVADLEALAVERGPSTPGPSTDPETDRALSGPLDLATLLSIARRRNPELRELAARAEAGLAEVRRAGTLDDPMLKLETEGVPLRQPSAFNRSEQNMIGLSQTIPFPGTLGLRSEVALRDAQGMREMLRERELELALNLKKAYFDYSHLARQLEIHREHARLLEAFERISSIRVQAGTAMQQDAIKPQVELVLLHAESIMIEQRIGSARASINRILHRPPDAPLGPPRPIVPPRESFDREDLAARALEARPERRAAELRVRGARAGLALSEREASLPEVSVGLDYMQMTGEPDGWAGMLSINLPWLTGRRSAEARKMERALRAEEAALEAAEGRILFEVRDAALRVEAARRSLDLLSGELLPKSAQSAEVSQRSYEKDKGSFLDLLDSERSLRDVQLKHAQAAAEYEAAVADLERAVGRDLRRQP